MQKFRATHLTALAVAALAGTSVALWPASAPAAAQEEKARVNVDPSGETQPMGYIWYHAGDGQENEVTVTEGASPAEFVIDDVVPIEPGNRCEHPDADDPTRVTCTVAGKDVGSTSLMVRLHDRNDTMDVRKASGGDVYGERGDDVLTSSVSESPFLLGGRGDDTLSGSDNMDGDAGNDTITGTPGNDTVTGGMGVDTIRTRAGEDTAIGDVGSDGREEGVADEIRAGAGPDYVEGKGGNDVIYGERGDDVLYGGQGTDQIDGGPGNNDIGEG